MSDETRIVSLEELAEEERIQKVAQADQTLVYMELRRSLRRHVETEITLSNMQAAHESLRVVVEALAVSGSIAAEHMNKLTSYVRSQKSEIESLKATTAEVLSRQADIAAMLDRHAGQIEQHAATQRALVEHVTNDITGETR